MRRKRGIPAGSAEPLNIIDISVKALFRELPQAVLRLAGISVDPSAIRVEDPNVNLPELRADHVFILDDESSETFGAIYVEYQLHPDPGLLKEWFVKCGGLTRQLGMPVSLLVLYLIKGDRATFPDSYSASVGGLKTEFSFNAIRLWEHAARIESGEFPELAPLLVLCYDKPTEQIVRREIELIQSAGFPENVQADLLALAARIASRNFARTVLLRLFKEVIPLALGANFVDDYIEENVARRVAEALDKAKAEAVAEALDKVKAEASIEGEAHGETMEARRLAIVLLPKRFGELPDALIARIHSAEKEWCESLLERAMKVETLAELEWEK